MYPRGPVSAPPGGYPPASYPMAPAAGGGYPGGPPPASAGGYAPPSYSYPPQGGGAGGGAGQYGAPRSAPAGGAPPSALDESKEMRLWDTSAERQKITGLQTLYSVIMAAELLDTVYNSGQCKEDEYTAECNRLISQYKTTKSMLMDAGHITSLDSFLKQYGMTCHLARRRLEIEGVPITTVTRSADPRGATVNVAETVQNFITTMDALRLGQTAVDDVQPQLKDLMCNLTSNPSLPPEFEAIKTLRQWLERLNQMRASEDLGDDEVRQLLFDLEGGYNAFHRHLKDSGK